jgi:hypothetical protein
MADAPASPVASVTGLAAQAIGALGGAPVLLVLVLINGCFVGAGGYYLLQVEQYRAKDREAIVGVVDKCITNSFNSVPVEYLKLKETKP